MKKGHEFVGIRGTRIAPITLPELDPAENWGWTDRLGLVYPRQIGDQIKTYADKHVHETSMLLKEGGLYGLITPDSDLLVMRVKFGQYETGADATTLTCLKLATGIERQARPIATMGTVKSAINPNTPVTQLEAPGQTPTDVLDTLTQSLASEDISMRRAAVEDLVALGTDPAIEVLKSCVGDPDLDFREFVIRHLAESLNQFMDSRWLVPVIKSRKGAASLGDAPRLIRLHGWLRVPALLSCLDFEDPAINSTYNRDLIYEQGSCEEGLRLPWIMDLNREGTSEELAENTRTLQAVRKWVDHVAQPYLYGTIDMRGMGMVGGLYGRATEEGYEQTGVADGVRIAIQCNQSVWPEGLPQLIKIQATTEPGQSLIVLNKPFEALEVEVNGIWYRHHPPLTEPTLGADSSHGRSFGNLILDSQWLDITQNKPLVLSPGKYKVRVRLSLLPQDQRTGLAMSQVIRFEVI